MPQRHCNKCGAFQVTPTPQADLFGGPLPAPAMSAFSAFHTASQRREAEARRRGVMRQIGAERQARKSFTTQCLRGASQ